MPFYSFWLIWLVGCPCFTHERWWKQFTSNNFCMLVFKMLWWIKYSSLYKQLSLNSGSTFSDFWQLLSNFWPFFEELWLIWFTGTIYTDPLPSAGCGFIARCSKVKQYTLSFIRTSNFGAEARRSYILRFDLAYYIRSWPAGGFVSWIAQASSEASRGIWQGKAVFLSKALFPSRLRRSLVRFNWPQNRQLRRLHLSLKTF